MPTFSLRITLRRLRKNKLYSSINIIGLATGITCVLLAVLYWKDERSYDNFHQRPSLYRITTTMAENKSGARQTMGGTGQVQGPAFKAGVPEVEDYVRLLGGGIPGDVIANNKGLRLKLLFADPSFFNIFSFTLLRGNPQTALSDINSVVITESAAVRFFNNTDVVGKELTLDADPSAKRLGKPMVISGVVKDLPENSSIQFDLLLPFRFLQLSFEDKAWLNAYLATFVVLHPGADVNAVAQKFNRIYSFYAKEQLAENIKAFGYDPAISYGLQPVTAMHLHPFGNDMESGIVNGSSPVFSWLFLGISIFILLMAGINFINISLANALQRGKEVGVRKISGGSRRQIIMQFLGESAVLCLIAFLLALLATMIALPVFNSLTGKHISFADAINARLSVSFILILLVIILFTGVYPAWVTSASSVKEVLNNKQKLSGRNLFGKSLVVLQFTLSIFLLITTLVYYSQMNFIRTKDLGYDPHEVIQTQIAGDREVMPVYRFLRTELARSPSVKAVSFGGGENVYEVKLQDQSIQAIHKVIDEHYLQVMGIPLKAGRNLSPAFPTDSSHAVIVNEAFVKAARLTSPIGTQLRTDAYFDKEPKTIIGVIKDYHTGSLRQPIKPMVLFMSNWYGGGILVKLEKSRLKEGMATLESVYKKAMPNAVYQYRFMDDINASQYEQEQRWQKIIAMATALSIAICCLGLFGLAHLATHQREKEIGIRKVLGATVAQVVTLLSAGFLKLVLIAIIIATPAGWLIMHKWLQDFAYRIDLGAGVFIISGVISISIALLAVSFQAMKTAMANPMTALRNE